MTATPQQCYLNVSSANAVQHTWCMYQHEMWFKPEGPPESVFISACNISDVFLMREARNNTDWVKLAELGYPITIKVEHTFSDRIIALNFTNAFINNMITKPRCNVHGYNMFGASRMLVCNDGREFTNQADAASKLGCSSSAISQHLSGKLPSIRGFTLRYKLS